MKFCDFSGRLSWNRCSVQKLTKDKEKILSLSKLLVICHVCKLFCCLTFENPNQKIWLKLDQKRSRSIKLVRIGSNQIKLDQVGSNWVKKDQDESD